MGNCYSDAGPGQEAVVDQDRPVPEIQATKEETNPVKEEVQEKKDEIKEHSQKEEIETKKHVAEEIVQPRPEENKIKEAEPGEVGESEQQAEAHQPSNTVDDSKTYERNDDNDGGEQQSEEEFSKKRKAKFASYVGHLKSEKLQKFLEKFEFASKPMSKKQVTLLFHALICLYLRKAEKIQELPPDESTKQFCGELSANFFDDHELGEEDKVQIEKLISWISKKELKKLYPVKQAEI